MMTNLSLVLQNIQNAKVIDDRIDNSDYIKIDLSKNNSDLHNFDIANAAKFEEYIDDYLTKNNAKVAFGGYLEKRNLYKRSTVFNNTNSEERDIHIGLDLWIKAGTSVLAAVDGKVHSFQNNKGLGDYGPTIILEHEVLDVKFYSLYGHLSEQSLSHLEIGKTFKAGQKIGDLGSFPINGDYAPHLHFQIIKEIGSYFGDYPGVCNQKDVDYFLENCPDPNLLLKI